LSGPKQFWQEVFKEPTTPTTPTTPGEHIIRRQILTQSLAQVALKKKNFGGLEYLGYVALLGDIGAVIQDLNNRGVSDDQKIPAIRIVKVFNDRVQGKLNGSTTTPGYSQTIYAARSPDKFYGPAVKINGKDETRKKAERATCVDAQSKTIFAPRSGVLNMGDAADALLIEVPLTSRFPKIGWPWQTCPSSLLDDRNGGCSEEPWAGLYSGSLYEIMLMLDLLSGVSPSEKAQDSNKKHKRAVAATAAGFLIATGMHSAAEEAYVIKQYLGELKPLETISGSCKGATDYVSALIQEHVATTKKRKLK